MSDLKPFFIIMGLCSNCFVVGCSSSDPEMMSVEGKVTYRGEAVPEGTVTFYPVAGGRPSTGHIESDGTYELSSLHPGDGARLGDHRVAIVARQVKRTGPVIKTFDDELNLARSRPKPPKITWIVPERYSTPDTSGLTATVTVDTDEINFDLQ